MSIIVNHKLIDIGFHPYYKAVLAEANTQGYVLPSFGNQILQNQLVVNLATAGALPLPLWDSLDWLYVLANNSGDADFGRINWINPTEIATGSPTVTDKKGWYGTVSSFGHGVQTGPNWVAGDCMMFFYSTVGGTVTATEAVMQQAGANGQYVVFRHRTNPRLDFIMNATLASPQQYPNAAAIDNAYYGADNNNLIDSNVYAYRNSTLMATLAGGTGILPDTSTLSMNTTSPRVTGIVGGGQSIYRHNGGTSANPAMNTILQTYMSAVQAL